MKFFGGSTWILKTKPVVAFVFVAFIQIVRRMISSLLKNRLAYFKILKSGIAL